MILFYHRTAVTAHVFLCGVAFELYLEFASRKEITVIIQEMTVRNIKISISKVAEGKLENDGASVLIGFDIRHGRKRPELVAEIQKMNGVLYLEEL